MNYAIEFDITGVTVLDADDAEHAEFLAREYVLENYPEVSINNIQVSTTNAPRS